MAVAPKRNALEILARLVPLNTLGEGELKELLDSAEFDKLKKGAVLFEEGDTASLNIYLLSGKVALLAGKQEMDVVDARDDTARFPLAHQLPRKFTAIARTRVEMVRIDNRRLGELIARASQSSYEVSAVDSDAPDDWMSQLLQLPVFQQLPPANIQRVIMGMEEVELEQDDEIFHQGDPGDSFYMINRGQCRITRVGIDGEEELARLGPGDSFGEESLLSGRPRAGTATMLSDGVLVRLQKGRFMEYVVEPLFRRVGYREALGQVDQGALWLDVRPPSRFEQSHLPSSLNLPLSSLRYQASSLDPERSYIVCGDAGGDDVVAAYLLLGQGLKVSLLEGGVPATDGPDAKTTGGGDVVPLHGTGANGADRKEEPEQPPQQQPDRSQAPAGGESRSLEELEQELGQARERLQQLEQERTADDSREQLAAALRENEALQAELQRRAETLKGLNAEKETAEACLADLEQTIEDLQGQLAEGRGQGKELKRLQQALEQEQEKRQRAAQQAERLEQEQARTGRELAAAEQRAEELQQRLAEAERAAAERDGEAGELRQSLQRACQEREAAVAAHQSLERERDQAAEAAERLQDQLQQAQQEAERLREREAAQESDRRAAEQALSEATDRIRELETALERQQAEAAQAVAEQQELKRTLERQQEELQRLARIEQQLQASVERMEELESQLAADEQRSADWQRQREQWQQREQELAAEVARLAAEKEQAEAGRQSADEALERQRQELEGRVRDGEESLAA
ncbi:MAG TPA: cyclic nucleotide-binding domain-containing protein, partial [Sedimenticola thiotaurini]|nr:cyclic nucleotide-binding domain-containing protein [Sedimenticola thiotaurini]